MLKHSRTVGLVAAGLFLAASPAWAQYYDNRSPNNTTVYTSPALGGNSGGGYGSGSGGYSGGGYGSNAGGYGGSQGGYGGGYGAAPSAESAAPAPLPADAAGRIEIRLQSLEEQIRRLTGRLEEEQHQVSVLKDRLERMQGDMEVRFKEMSAAPAEPAAPPSSGGSLGSLPQRDPGVVKLVPPAAKSGLPAGSTKEQYDYAFNLVRSDYAQAEVALKEFIAAHPKDKLAGSAQYWLGETYFARDNFQEAAVAFLTAFQKYPDNPKAADSLYKLGMSLNRLGKKPEACAALGKLASHPEANDALKRRAQSERSKLGCG